MTMKEEGLHGQECGNVEADMQEWTGRVVLEAHWIETDWMPGFFTCHRL